MFSFILIFVNLIFLMLGVLLYIYVLNVGIEILEKIDLFFF